MKDLEGKLDVFDPLSVLQLMHGARATGSLRLIGRSNRAMVFFDKGNITFARIEQRTWRLGQYLVEQGFVEQDTVEGYVQRKDDKKLGARLVHSGIVDLNAVRDAVGEQIRAVIYEIVRWHEGKFTFSAGEMPVGEDILNHVPLDQIMMEGVRRMDEGEGD